MPITIGQGPDHGFDEPLGLLSDCHRRVEHFLEVLVAFNRQAAGRPLIGAERSQLEGSLTYFATAAPKHTADEEESLFPRLRASTDPAARVLDDVLARLEHDHDDANGHHRQVDSLIRRWIASGSLAPADVRELGEHLAALQAIYQSHIAVEDRELFPAAGRLLSAGQVSDIGREMAARRSLRWAPATAGVRGDRTS